MLFVQAALGPLICLQHRARSGAIAQGSLRLGCPAHQAAALLNTYLESSTTPVLNRTTLGSPLMTLARPLTVILVRESNMHVCVPRLLARLYVCRRLGVYSCLIEKDLNGMKQVARQAVLLQVTDQQQQADCRELGSR
jgi:hypothetical protein